MLYDEDLTLEELGIDHDRIEVDRSFGVGPSVDGDDDSPYSSMLLGMSRED